MSYCKHELDASTCSLCRPENSRPVYISAGGTHVGLTSDCVSLARGQAIVQRRGGAAAPIERVTGDSRWAWERDECSDCFHGRRWRCRPSHLRRRPARPDCLAAEEVKTTMIDRDRETLNEAGMAATATAWWPAGFTPNQAIGLHRNGLELADVEVVLTDGYQPIDIRRVFR